MQQDQKHPAAFCCNVKSRSKLTDSRAWTISFISRWNTSTASGHPHYQMTEQRKRHQRKPAGHGQALVVKGSKCHQSAEYLMVKRCQAMSSVCQYWACVSVWQQILPESIWDTLLFKMYSTAWNGRMPGMSCWEFREFAESNPLSF